MSNIGSREKEHQVTALPFIEHEPAEIEGWFDSLLVDLRQRWTRTGHTGRSRHHRWACEIYNKCKVCDEHVSIACSLAQEADNIGLFLSKTWEKREFTLFLQLYLIIQCEFVRNLYSVGTSLGVPVRNPPKRVTVWGNSFAKHRLCLLTQHHPAWIVADAYGQQWTAFKDSIPSSSLVDRCGEHHRIEVIDYQWLSDRNRGRLAEANSDRHAVIVLPPLAEFLEETIQYLREFVDVCLKNESLLRQFESEHYTVSCW